MYSMAIVFQKNCRSKVQSFSSLNVGNHSIGWTKQNLTSHPYNWLKQKLQQPILLAIQRDSKQLQHLPTGGTENKITSDNDTPLQLPLKEQRT